MVDYIGDFRAGVTIRHFFNTNAVAGESITMATDGTFQVYKDGDVTQDTDGLTFLEDFDGLTGVHRVTIDTTADATFYSEGSDFMVAVSGATIDGKAINAALFTFSLANRSGLMPTTAGRKLDVSAGGEAGIDLANVGSPTTTLNLSGTTIAAATTIGTTGIDAIAAEVLDVITAAGLPITIAPPLFNPDNLEITVPFGADLTAASALGKLEIPSTVAALNLSTAGGTIRFSVRITNELAGSTPVFNVTGTAVDADTGGFELTDPTHTRRLQPGGTYFWSMTHETAGGLVTPLNAGRYIVQDVATYN